MMTATSMIESRRGSSPVISRSTHMSAFWISAGLGGAAGAAAPSGNELGGCDVLELVLPAAVSGAAVPTADA